MWLVKKFVKTLSRFTSLERQRISRIYNLTFPSWKAEFTPKLPLYRKFLQAFFTYIYWGLPTKKQCDWFKTSWKLWAGLLFQKDKGFQEFANLRFPLEKQNSLQNCHFFVSNQNSSWGKYFTFRSISFNRLDFTKMKKIKYIIKILSFHAVVSRFFQNQTGLCLFLDKAPSMIFMFSFQNKSRQKIKLKCRCRCVKNLQNSLLLWVSTQLLVLIS